MRVEQLKGFTDATKLSEVLGIKQERRGALEYFVSLPFPDKQSEAYRYASLADIWDRDLEIMTPPKLEPRAGKHIVITDGAVSEAPVGVDIQYLDSIDIDDQHYDPLYYLSHALSPYVIEIAANEDITIEHHIHTSGALIPYRIRLLVSPNSQIRISERFVDMAGEGRLLLYGYDVVVGRDATLTMIKDQTIDDDRYKALASHSFDMSYDSTLEYKSFDFGAGVGVQQMRIVLDERAVADISHLLYAEGNARRGTVSQIIHRGKYSTSKQIAKNILQGDARGIFDALIRVDHSAKYTKAHQNSKAILLNNGAYMASKPQLEIYIDELEASHGSTTGQLDARQLFYLRSRGIDIDEARKMLILAFANEIIDTISEHNLREQIHASFEQTYYRRLYIGGTSNSR